MNKRSATLSTSSTNNIYPSITAYPTCLRVRVVAPAVPFPQQTILVPSPSNPSTFVSLHSIEKKTDSHEVVNLPTLQVVNNLPKHPAAVSSPAALLRPLPPLTSFSRAPQQRSREAESTPTTPLRPIRPPLPHRHTRLDRHQQILRSVPDCLAATPLWSLLFNQSRTNPPESRRSQEEKENRNNTNINTQPDINSNNKQQEKQQRDNEQN